MRVRRPLICLLCVCSSHSPGTTCVCCVMKWLIHPAQKDEQCISANSTHALFARWEMSKRKKQGVCGARARRRSRRRFAEVPFGKPQIAAELFRSPREKAPQSHEKFSARPALNFCEHYCIFSCFTFLSMTWREASWAFMSFRVIPYSAINTST